MLNAIRSYIARRQSTGVNGNSTAAERAEQFGQSLDTGAAEIEITPFFASVHSYVALAEQTPLSQLRELMNAYFEGCVTEIQRESGDDAHRKCCLK